MKGHRLVGHAKPVLRGGSKVVATMKLYGFPPTRSIRVLWVLRELGVDFDFVNVNLVAGGTPV